jgi:hypothetical protein
MSLFTNCGFRTLYKYAPWPMTGDNFAKKNLRENTVYFPKASCFNDPFDSSPQLNFDGATVDKWRNTVEELLKINQPERPADEIRAEVKRAIKTQADCPTNNVIRHVNDLEIPEFRDRIYGVLCLTPHPDNMLMWSHYASHHRGICIGYDVEKLQALQTWIYFDKRGKLRQDHFNMLPINVRYEDHPDFNFFQSGLVKLSQEMLEIKAPVWEYEQEIRVILGARNFSTDLRDSDRVIRLQRNTISEVILGIAMPKAARDDIIATMKSHQRGAKIKHVVRKPNSFDLQIKRLP